MRTLPAHGGYPGEVVVERLPATTYGGLANAGGYVHVGDCMVHVEAMRALPVSVVAAWTGESVDDLLHLAGTAWFTLGLWTDVRSRTSRLQDPGDLPL